MNLKKNQAAPAFNSARSTAPGHITGPNTRNTDNIEIKATNEMVMGRITAMGSSHFLTTERGCTITGLSNNVVKILISEKKDDLY